MEKESHAAMDQAIGSRSSEDSTSVAVNEYLQLVDNDHQSSILGHGDSKKNAAAFRNVKVWGNDSQHQYLDTVASVLELPMTIMRKLFSRKPSSSKTILYGIDGVIQEGETLLVLGRPETFRGWTGDVVYYGLPVDIVKKNYRADLVYNAERDVHFPYLSVWRTLGFAVQTKTEGSKRSERTQKVNNVTEALLKVFALEGTKNTLVGNEFINSVSGGERKRVSLAEVMSTNAKVSLWDNSTQGLDSTTAVRFGQALQTYVKSGHKIAAAAIYQASDDLVNLFDKVTLLHEGRQIFFGTISEAQEFLDSLGFSWSDRQSLSEYLISVTDPDERITKEGWEDRVPRMVQDWERCWKESMYYRKLQTEIDGHFNSDDGGHAAAKTSALLASKDTPSRRSTYVLTWRAQLATTLKRALIRLAGDRPFLGASIVGPIFISLILGSVFYNSAENTDGFFSRQGVLFFSILFNSIQTMVEIASQFAQRPIVKKQSGFAMYRAGIDAIASLVSIYPLKFVSVTLFNIVLYFLANLKREAGAFFTFMLFTYTTVLIMASLFRLIAALNTHEAIATSIGGVFILPLVIYTGYVIPRPSMHPWFKWISYINPLSYAFDGLMANEFHGRYVPCSHMVPSGPAYANISPLNQVCPVTGSDPGSNFVSGDRYIDASFGYTFDHLWRNYGILIAYFVGFIILYGLVVEFVPQEEKGRGDVLIFLRRKRQVTGVGNVTSEKQTGLPGKVSVEPGESILDPTKVKSKSGLLLEGRQQNFTWDRLEYTIPVKGGSKTLLANIHGFVKPGTMTALMGASGAGKTTLLNVLAQRISIGTVQGDILMNGLRPDKDFARRTGYVESQDIHLSEFTVRETLRFSAHLRQSQNVSDKEKNEYVEEVIEMLDMADFSDAVVGVPGSGLSLEQRKRMTVGVELVAKPSLLFLDEPTSGLDSQSSFAIVKCLRKLANSGQAILCTIHQPSSGLFEQFDRLLLLQKGGRCVYFGDIGPSSEGVINYFETHGALKCAPKTNPAEYILKVTEAQNGRDWAEIWQKSEESRRVEREIASLNRISPSASVEKAHASPHSRDTTSYLRQYQLVQQRSLKWYWRSPVYIRGKAMLNLVAGLFIGFTFYQQINSAQGLQNKMFATFMSMILSAPLMNQLQPRFFQVRSLFVAREEPPRMYHWSIFVITIVVTEIVTNVVISTWFFIPWYFGVGFRNDMVDAPSRGAYQWIMFLMFEMWISTFGQLLAAVAPSEQTAALFIPMLFVFVALFCGVLQPLSQLPGFWHFVHYASPFTWLIDGLFSNVLHLTTVTCSPSEINIFQPPSNTTCGSFTAPFLKFGSGTLYNPNATRDCEYCRYSTGDQYLRTLDMNWDGRWRNFGVMWVYVLFNVGMLLLATGLPRWVRERKRVKTG